MFDFQLTLIAMIKVVREGLFHVYYGFINSHLEYGAILWANISYANSILVLQKRAIPIMCGVHIVDITVDHFLID